jgi:hypothetical protein
MSEVRGNNWRLFFDVEAQGPREGFSSSFIVVRARSRIDDWFWSSKSSPVFGFIRLFFYQRQQSHDTRARTQPPHAHALFASRLACPHRM